MIKSINYKYPNKKSIKAAGRFILTSGFSAVLSLSLPIVFVNMLHFRAEGAVALVFIIVFHVNFFNVRWFVFRSNGSIIKEYIGFLVTNGIFRLIDYSGFIFLFRVLNIHYVLSLFIVLSITTAARFLVFNNIFIHNVD